MISSVQVATARLMIGSVMVNERRKAALLGKIENALLEARVYTAENMLQGRELSLAITKLQEAQMWANLIHARPDPTVDEADG